MILKAIPANLKINALKTHEMIKTYLASLPLNLKCLNLRASNGSSATNK